MKSHKFIQCFLIGVALTSTGILPGKARAENFERGQHLFEDHCRACHGDLMFAEKQGIKAKSLGDLRKKIASWAEHGGMEWGNEEVDDVLQYMNKTFYHFKSGEF